MSEPRQSRQKIEVRNPYSGDVIGEVACAGAAEIERAVQGAMPHLKPEAVLTRQARSDILLAAAGKLATHADKFAGLIVAESGKVISQARSEVSRAISTLKLAAAECLTLRGEEIPFDAFGNNAGIRGYFSRAPIGLIAGITPFNDPLNLTVHKVAPAIAAGAPILLKPSEWTPLCAITFRRLLLDVGLDESFFRVLPGDLETGRRLTTHSMTRMISFTGGMRAAETIIREAGVRTYSFDLGGNAPVIVTQTANIPLAVERCVSGAFWANGHNCISVQRILVQGSVFDAFFDQFLARVRAIKVGDPSALETNLGPVINSVHAERIERIIADTRAVSPKSLAHGGRRHDNLIEPTVFVSPDRSCPCWADEVFGPVVSVRKYNDLDEAVRLANETETALNAGVFCQDLDEALWFSDALEFSAVMVNESSDFRFDNMPFGGAKRGGVGREGVRFAIEEMTRPKVRAVFPNRDRAHIASQET